MVESLKRLLSEYQNLRSKFFMVPIKKPPGTTIDEIGVKGDEREGRLVSDLKQAMQTLSELEDLYEEFFDHITMHNGQPCLHALFLPYEVPISLSGKGVLAYEYDGRKHQAICALGVVPQPSETLAFTQQKISI